MSTSTLAHRKLTRLTAVSVLLIVGGGVLFLVGVVLDWGGFWGGAAQGAAVALAVVGAYLWGYANGLRRAGSAAVWLPSSDDVE